MDQVGGTLTGKGTDCLSLQFFIFSPSLYSFLHSLPSLIFEQSKCFLLQEKIKHSSAALMEHTKVCTFITVRTFLDILYQSTPLHFFT